MIFGGGSIGGGAIGTGIVFTLYDEFSRTSDVINEKMKNMDGVTEKMVQSISESLTKMKLGFASMVVGAAILGALSFPVDKAAEFEQQLSSIRAVSGATNAQMKLMSDLALEQGKKTKFSALESAQGIEELYKAGVSLEQILNGGLDGALSLASAGELGVADAAMIASTALNTFRSNNLSVTQAADILAGAANASATDIQGLKMGLSQIGPVAEAVKLSFLDTNTALAVFAQNGLKGSDAGTSLKNMLLNLIPTSKQQIEVSKKLGLITKDGNNAFFDQNGQMKDLSGIAQVMQKSFGNLTDEQRLYTMGLLFGSDAIRASNILFKEGTKGVNDMQMAMQKFTAADVAKERLNNFKGAMENFRGSWETMMIVIGQPFLKPLSKVIAMFQKVIDLMTSFAQTKIGKVFFLIAGAVGVAAIALGAYVVAVNLSRFASAQAALAFKSLAMESVAVAFAEGGLTAGTYALATALWTMLAPLLPIIAAILAVVGVIYLAYRGFQDFNRLADGTGEKLNGLRGFFQKVGGAIKGFMEIWSSATDEGFSLSQRTHDALQKIGMLEFVLAMATWMGRLRMIWVGFKDTIVPILLYAWQKIKEVFTQVKGIVVSVLESLGFHLDSLSGSMETFRNIGKVLAYTVLVPLIGFLLAMAIVAAVLVTAIILVAGVFWLVYNAIMLVWHVLVGFVKFWATAFGFLADIVASFVQFFIDIFNGKTFAEAGHNLVEGLKNGILSAWEGLKSLVVGLIRALPFGDKILGWLGVDTSFSDQSPQGNVSPDAYNSFGAMTGLGKMTGTQNGAKAANNGDGSLLMMPQGNNQQQPTTQKFNLYIDGREVKTVVDKHDDDEQSRN